MSTKSIGKIFEESGGVDGLIKHMQSGLCDCHELKIEKGIYSKLKTIYDLHLPYIMKRQEESVRNGYDPYFVQWTKLFSPIESDCWNIIRGMGVSVWPQFPTMGVILDFANPYLKIGIECDGKKWHDPAEDKKRDQRLHDKEGWKIYRIQGSEFYREFKDTCELHEDGFEEYEDEYQREIQNWIMNTGDGVIKSINEVYFKDGQADDIYYRSLSYHKYAYFEI